MSIGFVRRPPLRFRFIGPLRVPSRYSSGCCSPAKTSQFRRVWQRCDVRLIYSSQWRRRTRAEQDIPSGDRRATFLRETINRVVLLCVTQRFSEPTPGQFSRRPHRHDRTPHERPHAPTEHDRRARRDNMHERRAILAPRRESAFGQFAPSMGGQRGRNTDVRSASTGGIRRPTGASGLATGHADDRRATAWAFRAKSWRNVRANLPERT